jgi:hypothetical protein
VAEVATLVISVASASVDSAVSSLRQLSIAGAEAETATTKLASSFTVLGSAIAALGLYEIAKDTLMLAARYETLGATLRVMAHNAGVSYSDMKQFQAGLEETGISAIKARQSLQVMAAAQLDLAEAARLGRVAQDAATLAGINSSDAFNNLVRGITTGEVRIIRHMGIMANFTVAHREYAAKIGKSVEALNAQERAQARLENVLSEGAKRQGVYEAAMTTAGKQMLSMQRYTENLQVQFGELFNPSTNELVFGLVQVLREVSAALKEWKESGEMGVLANNMRENLSTVFNGIVQTTKVLWDFRGAIMAVGGAVLTIKLGSWISEVANKTTLWYASIQQGAAIRQNELRDVIATTNALRAKAAERLIDLQNEKAASIAANKFWSPAMDSKIASAQRTFNGLVREGVAAQNALTVATKGTSAAKELFSGIVSAMGGPIGIAITAIAALGYAYYELRNKIGEAAEETSKFLAKSNKETDEENARLFEYYRLLAAGQFKAAEEQKKMNDVLKDPAVRKAGDDIANLNKQLKDLMDPTTWEHWRARMQDAMLGLGGLAGLVVRIVKGSEVEKRQKEANDAIALLASQRTNRMSALTTGGSLQNKIDNAKKPSDASEVEAAQNRFIAFNKEMNRLQESLNVLKMQSLGYSKEEVASYRAEQDLIQKISDVWEGTKIDKKGAVAKYTKEQALALQDLYTKEWIAKDALIAYNAEQGRQLATASQAKKAAEDNAKTLEKLEEELTRLTHTERDRFVLETRLLALSGMTDEAIDARIARFDELTASIVAGNKAKEEAAYIEQQVTAANKREKETEDRLSDLEKMKASGKLLAGVYEKTWMEIMSKADTAAGYMYQVTESLFTGLGNALGQMMTGARVSFREMMSSLAADIARFMANQAIMKFFQLAVKWYLGRGSGENTGGSMSGGNSESEWFDQGAATGGFRSGAKPYMVGEKGPELFVPGQSGTIIPNEKLGGGEITNISVVVNMTQGESDKTTSNSDDGRQTGLLIASAVRAVIIDERRPGGLLFAGA